MGDVTDKTKTEEVTLSAEKVTNMVNQIGDLTDKVKDANAAKSEAEAKLEKLKQETDSATAILNSKIKVLEDARLIEVEKVRTSAIANFKEIGCKVLPKETLDELVTSITDTKAETDLINKFTEALNKVNPLVSDKKVSSNGDYAPKAEDSDLNYMKPAGTKK